MSNRSTVEFVKWTQQHHPDVYRAAVSRVIRKSSLGGLGDNLTSDLVFDPGSVNVSDSANSAINAAASGATSGNSWSDIINSIAGAIGTVAPQIVQTKAQLSTIQINQQRAAQGYPPIGSASLLTGQGLGGNTGLMIGMAVLLGGGLLLMSGKKR
jgi:hypothetical protein